MIASLMKMMLMMMMVMMKITMMMVMENRPGVKKRILGEELLAPLGALAGLEF